jgi:hypothetical protein
LAVGLTTGIGASGSTGFLGFKGRLAVALGMGWDSEGSERGFQFFSQSDQIATTESQVSSDNRGGDPASSYCILLGCEDAVNLD